MSTLLGKIASHLRVFPATNAFHEEDKPEPTVHVRLGDLLPLLTAAQRRNYLFLRDFLDDEVCITSDLYEVLRAFQNYRSPA